MIAPLVVRRAPVGLIEVEARPGREFHAVDLQILEGLAGVFALALERLQGIEANRTRLSRETDRRSASEVQRSLMAQTLPASSGMKVDTRYLPAMDVGGDFFEVADLGGGRVGAAIGDVAGKGVSAALIMSRVSSDVRRELRTGANPARVLQSVNTSCSELAPETFVTASCIRVDTREHALTVANAGHLPLLVRRPDGRVFDFGSASGTPLGVMVCEYTDDRIQLAPNDIVLLMTDGLVDALDGSGDGTASRELKRIVRDAPHDPAAINTRILEAVDAAPGPGSRDDVTLVALQVGAG
jgi:serine phosphatase RsbU (regulator of sigma subunit)